MFKLVNATNRSLRTLTAGGTIAPGDLVVLSGSANTYTALADNGVLYQALAVTGAASAGTFRAYELLAGDELLATAVAGTYAAGMEGDFFGVSAAGTLDLDNTTQKALHLLNYDSTSDTARVQTIPAATSVES